MIKHIAVVAFMLVAACKPTQGKVLGGIDGDAYCKSKGMTSTEWRATPGVFDGRKTWGCVAADGSWGPYSIGVVCSQQYRTTAHAEQQREDDPISWICVEGAGPPTPPATWNRANM